MGIRIPDITIVVCTLELSIIGSMIYLLLASPSSKQACMYMVLLHSPYMLQIHARLAHVQLLARLKKWYCTTVYADIHAVVIIVFLNSG